MGALLASAIMDKAEILLQDTSNVRWSEAELLGWLNDGQRAIVVIKPDAHVTNDSYQLVAGTKQTLPDGTASYQNPSAATLSAGILLIDVIRNMGTDGSTIGNAVTIIERDILDRLLPTWHSATASATVKHYMFNERDPKRFYVYPPQPAASMGWVEVAYASLPADVAAKGNAITLDDIYSNALLYYILFRAYSKDADYTPNASRAVSYYEAFTNCLLNKEQREKMEDPNLDSSPSVSKV